MNQPTTRRHPVLRGTYFVNNVEVVGDPLPDGWSVEWEVSSYYHEDDRKTHWQDSLTLVKRPSSPDYDPDSSFHSENHRKEFDRYVDHGRPLYSDEVYYTKRDIVDSIQNSRVVVSHYESTDDWSISHERKQTPPLPFPGSGPWPC